jgi:hypothetical protein
MTPCNFPDLIDWIDDYGIDILHKEHDQYCSDNGSKKSFSAFVNEEYAVAKCLFIEEINRVDHIDIEMNVDGEIQIESAKLILLRIIERGIDANMIMKIIEQEDLAPDYRCAISIVNAFWDVIIPKIEKALKD